MARKLSFGQYVARTSFIHACDPRVKILGALAVMISCFFIQTPLQLAFGYLFCAATIGLSRIGARRIFDSMKHLIVVLALLSLFNLLVRQDGTPVVQLGLLTITQQGLWAAVLYTLRLIIAVVAASLLLFTTTPTLLTDAIDALLKPLSRLGLPGHEIAMIFSLMLRFIPTLADEATAIMDAQTARGGSLATGSLPQRIRAAGAVVIALLASSMRHANGLSRALDARSYEGVGRSHLHPLHMRAADWAATAGICFYVVVLLALGTL
ncbi:MAG: energy-coupling factor transporter transmembrane component T family protein [Atopobiaceae bacterium]|jgi:energy-coupling factor transport system permease protein